MCSDKLRENQVQFVHVFEIDRLLGQKCFEWTKQGCWGIRVPCQVAQLQVLVQEAEVSKDITLEKLKNKLYRRVGVDVKIAFG